MPTLFVHSQALFQSVEPTMVKPVYRSVKQSTSVSHHRNRSKQNNRRRSSEKQRSYRPAQSSQNVKCFHYQGNHVPPPLRLFVIAGQQRHNPVYAPRLNPRQQRVLLSDTQEKQNRTSAAQVEKIFQAIFLCRAGDGTMLVLPLSGAAACMFVCSVFWSAKV